MTYYDRVVLYFDGASRRNRPRKIAVRHFIRRPLLPLPYIVLLHPLKNKPRYLPRPLLIACSTR